jgi:hypothetical protein
MRAAAMTTYYKWLCADNSAPIGRGKWTPNRWRFVKGELIPCKNGLHLCRPQDILHHINERLWTVEADTSELIEAGDKVVVRRARLLAPVTTINEQTLRLFACDCAERVEHLAKDERSANAIAVARRYAHGKATKEELDAAKAAAPASAGAAAWAFACTAAWAAAWAAARAAARYHAWDAQTRRLMQYIEHGEAAEAMPYGE